MNSINKKYRIMLAIGIALLCITLIYFFVGFSGPMPYIETNSIVYHLDEDGTVTSIDITIKNPSFKTYKNETLILRYCDENSYPEGYSSPIEVSLMPFETKIITIDNFRNAWFYNADYHLETDSDSSAKIWISNQNFDYLTLTVILTVILAIVSTSLIIPSAIKIKKSKS